MQYKQFGLWKLWVATTETVIDELAATSAYDDTRLSGCNHHMDSIFPDGQLVTIATTPDGWDWVIPK